MARLTNAQRDQKMLEAKGLYIKNMSLQSICTIIGISVDTLKKWKKSENWDNAKKMHALSVSELKNEILETFHSLKNGETPDLSSDQISKLASAFEKLSDRKKNLAYMYDNFNELSERLAQNVAKAKGKDKQAKLETYKYVRSEMQKLTAEKYEEALND